MTLKSLGEGGGEWETPVGETRQGNVWDGIHSGKPADGGTPWGRTCNIFFAETHTALRSYFYAGRKTNIAKLLVQLDIRCEIMRNSPGHSESVAAKLFLYDPAGKLKRNITLQEISNTTLL